MTFFRDSSEYVYSPSAIPDRNVGWLSPWRSYAKGPVPAGFLDALRLHVAVPRNQTRGFHRCGFCLRRGREGLPAVTMPTGVEVPLGSAEIHLFSAEGIIYSSPDLIYHYVECHGYRPPGDYVEAVMAPGLNREVLRRLREVLVRAQEANDRIDAALDLLVMSPYEAQGYISAADLDGAANLFLKQKLMVVERRLGTDWQSR
ncbi:hypothetical protein GCM10022224_072250 [Nonomuraea antimicrobica]|uniref:DUF7919 domain-containing protein n=1 Tax=Nonomuraea antimicrobica TaxID=561173 RepID=A0ABP7CTL8_9ACTN